jgi:hypothetical protein
VLVGSLGISKNKLANFPFIHIFFPFSKIISTKTKKRISKFIFAPIASLLLFSPTCSAQNPITAICVGHQSVPFLAPLGVCSVSCLILQYVLEEFKELINTSHFLNDEDGEVEGCMWIDSGVCGEMDRDRYKRRILPFYSYISRVYRMITIPLPPSPPTLHNDESYTSGLTPPPPPPPFPVPDPPNAPAI